MDKNILTAEEAQNEWEKIQEEIKAAEEKRKNKWYRRVARKAMTLFAAITTTTAAYQPEAQAHKFDSEFVNNNKQNDSKDLQSDTFTPVDPKDNETPQAEVGEQQAEKQTEQAAKEETAKRYGKPLSGKISSGTLTGKYDQTNRKTLHPRGFGFKGGIAPKETPEQKALREKARAEKRIAEILASNRNGTEISFADYVWVFNYCQNNTGNDELRNTMRTSALRKMREATNNKATLSQGDAYRMDALIEAVRRTLDENNPNDLGNLTTVNNFEASSAEIKKASEMQAKLDEYNAIPAWRRWMVKKPEEYKPLQERQGNVDKMFKDVNLDFSNRDNYAASFGAWLKVVRENKIKVDSENMEFALALLPKGKDNDTIRFAAQMAVKEKWPLTSEGKVDRFKLDRAAQLAYGAAESHTYGGDKKTEKTAEPKKGLSANDRRNINKQIASKRTFWREGGPNRSYRS